MNNDSKFSELIDGQWRCFARDEIAKRISERGGLTSLLPLLDQLPTALKDNHRSTVRKGTLLGFEVVVKRPKDKNGRAWARFLSMFSHAEAFSTFINLRRMVEAGVETTQPLFAIEKRVKGMVVDSWICYEFREGEPVGRDGLGQIIELLNLMHKNGFRHGDPTWNNFLIGSDDVVFTIDTTAKPCAWSFHSTYDFVLLKRSNKIKELDIRKAGNLNRLALGYNLAMLYMVIKAGRSWLKDRIKRNRPKNI